MFKRIAIALAVVATGACSSAAAPPAPAAKATPTTTAPSLLAYCSEAYGAFNARHPENVPVLTPAQQCQSGIDEGVLVNQAAVDSVIAAGDEMFVETAPAPADKCDGVHFDVKVAPGDPRDRDQDGIACEK